MKRTDELVPGDRIALPGGAVRTVSHVTDAGYVNSGDLPIRIVHYVERPDRLFGRGNWVSTGNTACDSTSWRMAR